MMIALPLLAAMEMGRIPVVVLLIYMAVLLGLGVLGYLKSRSSEEDYYLAGRGQGVLVTVLTIMATFFSSAAMLGIPGLIYRDGTAFLFFALNLPVSGAAIYFIGSRVRRIGQARGYVTPGDLVADYYGGSRLLRMLVALVGFLYVIPYIIMQIKAGGYLAQRLFPDAAGLTVFGQEYGVFELGTIALSVLTMLYVLIGGMRSVAWTDVIQGVLLLSGMLVAGLATVMAMGGVSEYFTAVRLVTLEATDHLHIRLVIDHDPARPVDALLRGPFVADAEAECVDFCYRIAGLLFVRRHVGRLGRSCALSASVG